jgi:hypothetical protein
LPRPLFPADNRLGSLSKKKNPPRRDRQDKYLEGKDTGYATVGLSGEGKGPHGPVPTPSLSLSMVGQVAKLTGALDFVRRRGVGGLKLQVLLLFMEDEREDKGQPLPEQQLSP